MSTGPLPLSLFEGYGIEIESMVVDAETLDVRPVVDELLREASHADAWVEDFDDGPIAWSNELVLHVVERKTNGPVASFEGLAERFRASDRKLNALLSESFGARLLPTGMHPWMDPTRETRLWPHDTGPVYRAYDRLFDCHRHGWSNLQSVHLNLPFRDEHEFARLMAAVRVVLPLIPALAASTPIVTGEVTGLLDNRLEVYRTNSERLPSMTGSVVPEPIFSIDEYRERVLSPIDVELAALGADEILRGQEWTNARGAIARFDRMAIEIRLIDAQECAAADLAIAAAVSALVRGLVEERWCSFRAQSTLGTEALAELLIAAIRTGPATPVTDGAWLTTLGQETKRACTMGQLLRQLVETSFDGPRELEPALEVILREGTLAERILATLQPNAARSTLQRELLIVYSELADCLTDGRSYSPPKRSRAPVPAS